MRVHRPTIDLTRMLSLASIVSGSDVCTGIVYPRMDSPHAEATLLLEPSASIAVPVRGMKRPHRGPIPGSLQSEHEDDYSDFESGTPVSASWPGEVYAHSEAYAHSPGVVPHSPQTPRGAKFLKAGHQMFLDAFAPSHQMSQSYQPAVASNMTSPFDFGIQSQSFPPVAVTLPHYGEEIGTGEGGITVASGPATIVRLQPSMVRTCTSAVFATQTRGSYAQSSSLSSLSFRRNSAPTSQRVQIPRAHPSIMSRPLRATYTPFKSSPIATAPDRVPTAVSPSLPFDGLQALSLTGRERETPPMIKEEPSGECEIMTVPFSQLLDPSMFHPIMTSQLVNRQSQAASTGMTSPLTGTVFPLNVSPIVTPTGGTTPIPRWSNSIIGGTTPEHQMLEDDMNLLLGMYIAT